MNILDEPSLKGQIAGAGLLNNPVYMGLLSTVQTCRTKISENIKRSSDDVKIASSCMLTAVAMLDTSMIPVDKEFKKVESAKINGFNCLQQGLMYTAFLSDIRKKYGDKAAEDMVNGKDHRGIIREDVVNILCNLAEQGGFMDIYPLLNLIMPIPRPNCEYMRLSKKAQEYVLSLGVPSKDVLLGFYDELAQKAEANGGLYAAVIQLTINNKPTYIYYTYCFGCFAGFRYGQTDDDNEYCYDFRHSPKDMERVFDDTVEEEDVFEMRGFLANIWASIVTKSFEFSSEPTENRKYIDKLVPVPKANYSSYRYLKITPDCEEKYNESQRIINSVRSDATYRKSIWFSRAYYARRGSDKKIVLCKASIHHRKCGEVVNQPVVTVLV
jgi:hypothetical protein